MTINIPTLVSQTLTNGVTAYAPSENVVYDALALKEATANKNTTNGYAGLTGLNIMALDPTGLIISYFDNANLTANRAWLLPDASGTLGLISQSISSGVTSFSPSEDAVYDALALKQATLVSATNIKTINGSSILGSGDLVVGGVAITSGYIPKGTGTTIADGLMYDNGTSISIGAGTSPSAKLHVQGSGTTSGTFGLKVQNSSSVVSLQVRDDGSVYNLGGGSVGSNTAFGLLSFLNNVTGLNNVAFGYQSLYNNTSSYNSAFGYNALRDNSSGQNNTVVGSSAGEKIQTGSYNTILGAFAYASASTGQQNTAIGGSSMTNASGNYNTALGDGAAVDITGNNNLFLGFKAGRYQTTENNQVFIDTLDRGTSADDKAKALVYGITNATVANQRLTINGNVGIQGTQQASTSLTVNGLGSTSGTFTAKFQNGAGTPLVSLQVRDDGSVYNLGGGALSGNLAFGELALIGNNSGTGGNVALGYEALTANTTGSYSVAVGFRALKTNTTGLWNIGIGFQALTANNGDANVAIGYQALNGNTTGYYNHAIGRDALLYNTTGFENTAIGYRCLYNNADGDDNIAIGYQALLANVSGNENIAIGYRALETSTGTGSVALGLDAGRAVGASAGGVFLGYGAGRYETGANKLFIDNQVRGSVEATGRTNALIYGIFDAAVANQRLTINASLIGGSAALATTATDGFWYVPSCAGLPTGVPTAQTGTIPMVVDSTNNKMYIYSGGAWVALN